MSFPITVCLDLDGVITNMNKSLGKALGVNMEPWPKPGEYKHSVAFGIAPKMVFGAMNSSEFWRDLETFSWGFPLIKYLEDNIGQENITILTKPTHDGDCYKGKFEWVEKNLPKYVDQVLIGSPKYACARLEYGILIDDSDSNIDAFKKYGGHGLLFAQPWNKRHSLSEFKLKILRDELEYAVGKKLPKMDFQ